MWEGHLAKTLEWSQILYITLNMGINQTIKHKADAVFPVQGTQKNSKCSFLHP